MKKIIFGGAGFFFFITVLFALGKSKPAIFVTGVSVEEQTSKEINQVLKSLKERIKKKEIFDLVEKVPDQVLKEIKMKIFQETEFPPEIEKLGYADYILLLKLFKSKDTDYMSASLIDEETGEIESSITFEYKGVGDAVERIFSMLVSKKMPVAPESEIKAGEKEYWVKIVATGIGKGPEIVARKVALIDAKRRAIEKAIGSVVDVKTIPDEKKREIVSTTSGYLKYKIVSQQVKNGLLNITIEAEVKIPEKYVKKYPAIYEKPPLETGYTPFTLTIKGVKVDWEKGVLFAEGVSKFGEKNQALLLARRGAIVEAQGKALEALKGIRVTQKKKAGDLGIEYHLRGIVRGGDVVKEWINNGEYHVVLKVPIYGISGLTGLLTDPAIESPYSYINQNQPSTIENLPFTGIIIDASSLDPVPSVIFRVFDEDGEPIYNEKNVDPEAFKKMGMAAFVIREGSDLKPYKWAKPVFPIFVASTVDYIYLARRKGRSHRFHYNGKKWWTRRRRQGRRPLRVKAVSLPEGGKIKTGVVISMRRGKNYRDIAKKLFRTARVVVITGATVGGTEGRISSPLWMGYLW